MTKDKENVALDLVVKFSYLKLGLKKAKSAIFKVWYSLIGILILLYF